MAQICFTALVSLVLGERIKKADLKFIKPAILIKFTYYFVNNNSLYFGKVQ